MIFSFQTKKISFILKTPFNCSYLFCYLREDCEKSYLKNCVQFENGKSQLERVLWVFKWRNPKITKTKNKKLVKNVSFWKRCLKSWLFFNRIERRLFLWVFELENIYLCWRRNSVWWFCLFKDKHWHNQSDRKLWWR